MCIPAKPGASGVLFFWRSKVVRTGFPPALVFSLAHLLRCRHVPVLAVGGASRSLLCDRSFVLPPPRFPLIFAPAFSKGADPKDGEPLGPMNYGCCLERLPPPPWSLSSWLRFLSFLFFNEARARASPFSEWLLLRLRLFLARPAWITLAHLFPTRHCPTFSTFLVP